MITMIVLPLISLYYFINIGAFDQFRRIDLGMPAEIDNNEVSEYKNSHQFKEFTISDDNVSNKIVIYKIDSLLKTMKMANDTINGINVKFDKQVTYNKFIDALDLLFIHDYKWFLIEEFEIWTVWNTPILNKKEMKFSKFCGLDHDLIFSEEKQNFHNSNIKDEREILLSKYKSYGILGLAYIILAAFSIIRLRKQQIELSSRKI